jgi:hypothetical protein
MEECVNTFQVLDLDNPDCNTLPPWPTCETPDEIFHDQFRAYWAHPLKQHISLEFVPDPGWSYVEDLKRIAENPQDNPETAKAAERIIEIGQWQDWLSRETKRPAEAQPEPETNPALAAECKAIIQDVLANIGKKNDQMDIV